MNASWTDAKAERQAARWLLAGIILLGFGLRVYRLDQNSLWVDEIVTQRLIQQPPLVMLARVIAYDVHPPLFYLLAAQARSLWGGSEFGVRFFSALVGTAIIPAAFVFGRALWGRSATLLGAAFTAASPFFLHYAQECRMYSLALFLQMIAFYWLYRAHQSGRRLHWAGFAFVATWAFYTHYLAVVTITLAAMTVISFELWEVWRASGAVEKKTAKKRLMMALLSFGGSWLAFLPWAWVLTHQMHAFSKQWGGEHAMSTLAASFFKISQLTFLFLSQRRPWEELILALLWGGGVALALWRQRWLNLALGSAPFWGAIFFLAIRIPVKAIFPHRVALLAIPWLIFILGGLTLLNDGLARLLPPKFAHAHLHLKLALLALLIFIFIGPSLVQHYRWRKEDWRGAAQYLKQHDLTGGVILADGVFAGRGGDGARVKQGMSYYLDGDATIILAEADAMPSLLQVEHGPVLGLIWNQGQLLNCDDSIWTKDFTNIRLFGLHQSTGSVLQDAIHILEAMLCMQPLMEARLDLHEALASLYLATDQMERGYRHLSVIEREAPADYEKLVQGRRLERFSWLLAKARTAATEGDMGEADRLFSQLVAMADSQDKRIKVLMAWGISHRFYGSMTRASELFLEVLSIDPAYTEARANYAATLYSRQRYQEALSQFEIVLSQAPNHFWAYYYSGLAYAQLGRQEQARAMLQKAMTLAPDDSAYEFARKAFDDLE